MRMLIDGQGVSMPPELYARTQERVCYMLVRYQWMVSWVAVQFTRFRPRDEEVCCQIDVWLTDIGAVTVQHYEPDPMEAVEMAALRLREAVRRRLARRGNPHLRLFAPLEGDEALVSGEEAEKAEPRMAGKEFGNATQ